MSRSTKVLGGREHQTKKRRDLKIADMNLAGLGCRDIAPIVGLSKTQVNAILNRDDIQAYIESVTSRLIGNTLESAYQNLHQAVMKYPKTKDRVEKDHGFRASLEVMRGAGVLPSSSQSVTIQQITNSQTNILSPMMEQMVRRHLGLPEAVDAEVEEIVDGEQ